MTAPTLTTKFTQTSIRREVSAALAPIRDALHAPTECPRPPEVTLYGLTFTGRRIYKAPGLTGYVWNPQYVGRSADGQLVMSGTIASIADALYWRLRAEAAPTAQPEVPVQPADQWCFDPFGAAA